MNYFCNQDWCVVTANFTQHVPLIRYIVLRVEFPWLSRKTRAQQLQHSGFCWGLSFQFSHTFSSGNTEPCCLSSCLTSSLTSPCHAHDVTTSWRQHTNLRRHRSRKKTLATCQWKKLATVLAFLWCLRCFCNDFHAHLSRSQELLEQTSGSSWIQLWHCPQSTGNIGSRT